jgi:hypothetical protein
MGMLHPKAWILQMFLPLFPVLLASLAFAFSNDKVTRDFDLKANLFFARYTIVFTPSSADVASGHYQFPMEFPLEKLSSISFTIDGKLVPYDLKSSFPSFNLTFYIFSFVILFLLSELLCTMLSSLRPSKLIPSQRWSRSY